ncbi:hypothetical protein ABZT03_38745 [Streptomyces sp. NPDC005574]
MSTFEQRMNEASDRVYQRIEDGLVTDADAELLQARLDASTEEDD